MKIEIEEALKKLKSSKSTGQVTFRLNEEAPVTFTKVDLSHFDPEAGGAIVGMGSDPESHIAFGFPGHVKDGPNSAKYKDDYFSHYILWEYKNASVVYLAVEGTLKINFSNNLQSAEGTFVFTTASRQKVSGEFSVKNP